MYVCMYVCMYVGRVDELSEYVMKSDDSSLLKWWASYLESIERFDKAKKFYNKAEDYLSLVRICCFQVDCVCMYVCNVCMCVRLSAMPTRLKCMYVCMYVVFMFELHV